MNLPSFLWLWRIAAWSMGLSLLAYVLLAATGTGMFYSRSSGGSRPDWLRSLHFGIGITMISLVLLLLAIGIVGTLGHFGSLGHSAHLPAGIIVVLLTLLSGWSATQINPERTWARTLHIGTNLVLLVGFTLVSLSGWIVVQKYLP
ncbi:MAG: DUF4079 domain-containing protein [Oculatellaceae cyanobacterium bins.114]|nr:DUF4079 domain-containing protein [Oculatellaceae cyanobacterium bins.114]